MRCARSAYERTTTLFRSRVAPSVFPAYVAQNASFVRQSDGESVVGFVGGGDEQCVEVWLTGGEIEFAHVYISYVKQQGEWRVDALANTEPTGCSGGI